MPNLVAATLELQDWGAGYFFEIAVGGLDGIPSVRGPNVVIPKKPGQRWMPKVEHDLLVTLRGSVHGEPGATVRESYLSRMTALLAIFSPTAAPFELVVYPTAEGVGGRVGASETATIEVEFLRLTGEPAFADQWRDFDLELRCISDPPAWTIE